MSEWKKVRLGELYVVHNGLSKPRDAFGSGFPFLSYSTVFNNFFLPRSLDSLVQTTEKEQEAYSIKAGDVFITRTSETADELGMSSVALYDYPNATYNGFCKRLRPITDRVYPRYVGYFLRTPVFRSHFNALSGSMTTRASLKNEDLLAMEIPLPPLPTQRKIAAVLSSLDDKIENNRKICANLEAQAQAIFKSWFVDFEPFGGKMPQGWKMEPLEGMAERIASGGTPRTKEESYYKGLIRWYSTKELKDCYLFDSEKHISEDAVANSAAKVFPRNTILMAIYAAPTVGRLGILDSESTFNQAAVGIVARREIGYAYLYLQLLNAREGLNLMAVGSCQQNLNVGVVKSYQILRPDNVILTKFNNLVDGLFDEIRALTKESRSLAALRDALLPKLMSGEIDVEKVKISA